MIDNKTSDCHLMSESTRKEQVVLEGNAAVNLLLKHFAIKSNVSDDNILDYMASKEFGRDLNVARRDIESELDQKQGIFTIGGKEFASVADFKAAKEQPMHVHLGETIYSLKTEHDLRWTDASNAEIDSAYLHISETPDFKESKVIQSKNHISPDDDFFDDGIFRGTVHCLLDHFEKAQDEVSRDDISEYIYSEQFAADIAAYQSDEQTLIAQAKKHGWLSSPVETQEQQQQTQQQENGQDIALARKAGYVQGVCECALVVSEDKMLTKKLLSEMGVTRDMAQKFANPETFKEMEQSVYAQKNERSLEHGKHIKL
ncbi:MAG: hypothetical protein MdMp014T_0196 [Treponematales bacterium]